MFELNHELLSGERQVAPSLDGIRPDHVARYRWAARYLNETGQNRRVLDLGCGVGYGAYILATEAKCEVVAVDASSQAIGYALEHYSDDRITYGIRDLTKPLVDRFFFDPYTAVVAFEIIEHLENPIPLLKMALRLASEGCVLLSVPNESGFPLRTPERPNGLKFHHRHYTRDDLVDLLRAAGITDDDVVNIGYQTDERSTRIQNGQDDASRTLVAIIQSGGYARRTAAEMLDFGQVGGERVLLNRWPAKIHGWSGPAGRDGVSSPLIARGDGKLIFSAANGSATYEESLGIGCELVESEWTDPALPRSGPIVEELHPVFADADDGVRIYASQPWPQRLRVPLYFINALPIIKNGVELAVLSNDASTLRFNWSNGEALYRCLQHVGDHWILTRLPGATIGPIPAETAVSIGATFETLATTYGTNRKPPPAAAVAPVGATDAEWAGTGAARVAGPTGEARPPLFADHPAKGKHVVILGMGPSLEGYVDLVKRLGSRRVFADEVWAVNAVADVVQHDRVFHMDDVAVQEIRAAANPKGNIAPMLDWLRTHPGPVYTSVARPGYPGLVAYPLADVINATGHIYFNSTVAYAVAYAVAVGVQKISMFGIDFTYPSAHKSEKGRACVEFWLAVALERDIEIGLAERTTIFDAIEGGRAKLYGFDAMDVTIDQQRDTTVAVSMTPKAALPTAEEIEAAYDHGVHPNAHMRTPKR